MREIKKSLSALVLRVSSIFQAVCFALLLLYAFGAVRAVHIATFAVTVSLPTIAGFDFFLAFVAAALASTFLAVVAAGLCALVGWNSAQGLRSGVLSFELFIHWALLHLSGIRTGQTAQRQFARMSGKQLPGTKAANNGHTHCVTDEYRDNGKQPQQQNSRNNAQPFQLALLLRRLLCSDVLQIGALVGPVGPLATLAEADALTNVVGRQFDVLSPKARAIGFAGLKLATMRAAVQAKSSPVRGIPLNCLGRSGWVFPLADLCRGIMENVPSLFIAHFVHLFISLFDSQDYKPNVRFLSRVENGI